MKIKSNVGQHKVMDFVISGDGILSYQGKLYISNIDGLREKVMAKAHGAIYATYPGSIKMYHGLRVFYWWNNMKHDVASHVAKCMVCQQVKVEHLMPDGLYQEVVLHE